MTKTSELNHAVATLGRLELESLYTRLCETHDEDARNRKESYKAIRDLKQMNAAQGQEMAYLQRMLENEQTQNKKGHEQVLTLKQMNSQQAQTINELNREVAALQETIAGLGSGAGDKLKLELSEMLNEAKADICMVLSEIEAAQAKIMLPDTESERDGHG